MKDTNQLTQTISLDIGTVTYTNAIYHRMLSDTSFKEAIDSFIDRFRNTDWGDLEPTDKIMNNKSISNGIIKDDILACYKVIGFANDIFFYYTLDYNQTTVMFAEEY